MKIQSSLFPWITILAGIFFSLYLLGQIPDGVYFSGDGGLKSLLAEQLSEGNFRIDLIPPAETWVSTLWEEGLYPYQPPFVYHLEQRYFLSFPFTFPLVTAPFYALFGFRGLYLIPLVSTWIIWLLSYFACRRLNFDSWRTSLTLFILIFASFLTLYSAMYWEHTLAVALGFAGMSILLIPKYPEGLSKPQAIFSGIFLGLSFWVRSEFLAMIALLIFLVYAIPLLNFIGLGKVTEKFNLKQLSFLSKNKEMFVASMFLTVGLLFLCNQLIYHHFLGIHAMLITEGFTLQKRLSDAWRSLTNMTFTFFEFFPIAWFSVLYLLQVIWQKARVNFSVKFIIIGLLLIGFLISAYLIVSSGGIVGLKGFLIQWIIALILTTIWLYLLRDIKLEFTPKMFLPYLISILFTIGVALLVDYAPEERVAGGKQWGQRYLLILLPFITFLIVEQGKIMQNSLQPIAKYSSFFMLSLLLLLGVYKNTYLGTQFFLENHHKSYPAIEVLRKSSEKVVVVSHQYAAQALESPLKGQKFWFQVKDSETLLKLGSALINQKQNKFIYVCYPYRDCNLPQETAANLTLNQDKQHFEIKFTPLGKFGVYPLYEGTIIQAVQKRGNL